MHQVCTFSTAHQDTLSLLVSRLLAAAHPHRQFRTCPCRLSLQLPLWPLLNTVSLLEMGKEEEKEEEERRRRSGVPLPTAVKPQSTPWRSLTGKTDLLVTLQTRGDKHRKVKGSQHFPQGVLRPPTRVITTPSLNNYHFLKEKPCFLNHTPADTVPFDPKQEEGTHYGWRSSVSLAEAHFPLHLIQIQLPKLSDALHYLPGASGQRPIGPQHIGVSLNSPSSKRTLPSFVLEKFPLHAAGQ